MTLNKQQQRCLGFDITVTSFRELLCSLKLPTLFTQTHSMTVSIFDLFCLPPGHWQLAVKSHANISWNQLFSAEKSFLTARLLS